MDIEAAAAIGDGESLNRNPSKKSFSQVFQGMIRRGKKKPTKNLVWRLRNPGNRNEN